MSRKIKTKGKTGPQNRFVKCNIKKVCERTSKLLTKFQSVYAMSHNNFGLNLSPDVRYQWKPSIFLVGKKGVLQKALLKGFSGPEEKRKDFNKFVECMKGQIFLFFTNLPKVEVLDWFSNSVEDIYAEFRQIASRDVLLLKGPNPQILIKHEDYLRTTCGMHITIEDGVVVLLEDYEVCKEGDSLTRKQVKILKWLGIPLLKKTFHVLGSYCKEEGFEKY